MKRSRWLYTLPLSAVVHAGAAVLRVDCWAGAPPLVAWYERQGFRRSGRFDVRGWIGQVFTMRLAP